MSQLNVTHTVKEKLSLKVSQLENATGTFFLPYLNMILISQDTDIVVIVDDVISTHPDIDSAAHDFDFSLDLDVEQIALGITVTPVYRK